MPPAPPEAAPVEEAAASGVARRRAWGPPSTATLLGLGLALIVWILELRPLIDNSFLIHLETGRWILDHGAIPGHDVYSFTAPGSPWVVQSWLASVVYAAIDATVGPFGLQVLRAATCALITFLVFRLSQRLVGDRTRATLLAFAATATSITVWSERPLLQGTLAMVILIWLVEVPESFVGRHPLAVVPPMLWLWANFHGTFALGFGYLALHLAGHWLDGFRPWEGRERKLLTATGVAALVCLVNPLGLSLLTFPVELLGRGDTLAHVREWRSPDFHSVMGMLFALWITAFAIGLARGRDRISRRDLLVSLAFLLLALWAIRNLVIAPLVGLPIVARALAVPERGSARRHPLNWAVLALLAILGVSAVSQAAGADHYDFSDYPVEAMEAVERQGLLGRRLLTTDAWGAYVIHRYGARQRVFIDDRYDMYPTTLADDYFALRDGKPEWREILDRHDIELIVWDRENPLATILDLDTTTWRRTFTDDGSAVWVRHRRDLQGG